MPKQALCNLSTGLVVGAKCWSKFPSAGATGVAHCVLTAFCVPDSSIWSDDRLG